MGLRLSMLHCEYLPFVFFLKWQDVTDICSNDKLEHDRSLRSPSTSRSLSSAIAEIRGSSAFVFVCVCVCVLGLCIYDHSPDRAHGLA